MFKNCMIWCITIRGTGEMQSRTNNNPEKKPPNQQLFKIYIAIYLFVIIKFY